MAGPFDEAGQMPFDPIVPPPENPAVAPKPVQQAVKSAAGAAGEAAYDTVIGIPKGIQEQSENLRQTGQYNPEPMYDAMLLLASGGLASPEAGAAGVFGGRLQSRKANLSKLLRAQLLELDNKSPQYIWKETGWVRGKDKDWRYEISDADAKLKNRYGETVGEMLDHPTLFEHYPDIANIKIDFNSGRGEGFYSNPSWHGGQGEEYISLNPEDFHATGEFDGSTMSVLLHEIQHAVQFRERFQNGANIADPTFQHVIQEAIQDIYFPEKDRKRLQQIVDKMYSLPHRIDDLSDAERREYNSLALKSGIAYNKINKLQIPLSRELYIRHAGEVEARNVPDRYYRATQMKAMDPQERSEFLSRLLDDDLEHDQTVEGFINKLPELTEDRSRSKQIVRRRPEFGETHTPEASKPSSLWGGNDETQKRIEMDQILSLASGKLKQRDIMSVEDALKRPPQSALMETGQTLMGGINDSRAKERPNFFGELFKNLAQKSMQGSFAGSEVRKRGEGRQEEGDYDYKAAREAGVKPDARGHLPDTYKKPNHITFSDESQYDDGGAGHWEKAKDGKWSFTPGPTNLKYHSMDEIRRYFKEYEPDAVLKEPKRKSEPFGQGIYNPFTDS